MADLHVTNTMQAFTNLPEDRYVNTLNFTWIGAGEMPFDDPVAMQPVHTAVQTFFKNISDRLSPCIIGTATTRLYRWSDNEPRVPLVSSYTLNTRSNAGTLEEVAFVLGFRGAPPHTRNRRGRIYIGPIAQVMIDTATAVKFSNIASTLTNDVVAEAQTMGDTLFDLGYQWVVSNRNGSTSVPIAEFTWDYSPDTQRRRGYKPTQRFTQLVNWATP